MRGSETDGQTGDGQAGAPEHGISRGADVIAFPSRPRPVPGAPHGDKEEALARLDRALLKLNHALGEQHAALKAWSEANQALAGSVLLLSERFRGLGEKLESLRNAGD